VTKNQHRKNAEFTRLQFFDRFKTREDQRSIKNKSLLENNAQIYPPDPEHPHS
jgi:hypothetical protein